MKTYDFAAAKRYIQIYADRIDYAYLGMKEDWFWTSEPVFEEGGFLMDLESEEINIGGIVRSAWATPTLFVQFKDGTELYKDCYTGESDSQRPEWFVLGPYSGPCQKEVDLKTSMKQLTN